MLTATDLFNSQKFEGEVLFGEPLSKHSSFRIGGRAEVLYLPSDEKSLIKAVKSAKQNGIAFRIIGNGTNILVPDEGLSGLTVKLASGLSQIIDLGNGIISCGAGALLIKLCTYARDNSLSGLEFAYGIPGSVGGALYMNAGAYGGEMKDVLCSVRCFSPETGEIKEIPLTELEYSYRNTSFMKNGLVITGGIFKLNNGDRQDISAKMEDLMSRRRDKQPLDMPSAGSTFKRPAVEGVYVGALMDRFNLKGYSVGGAQVSTKHGGFVVNKGGATCEDVLNLIKHIQKTVKDNTGIELIPEVETLK